MRIVTAALFVLATAWAIGPAHADQYRWCAVYGGNGDGDGGTNCYFVTLEQCEAAISGAGGFCTPSPWYKGRPASGREDSPAGRRRTPPRR
jgi:hypothetical protein